MKPIVIHIPDPCNENWHAMNEVDGGRFCLKCQKHVIDFSELSDEEITTVMRYSMGKICGRFKAEQVGRPLKLPPVKRKTRKYPEALAALLLLAASEPLVAQNVKPKIEISEPNLNQATKQKIADSDTVQNIRGKVIDLDKNVPLIGAIVQINESSFVTRTDSAGNFVLSIPPMHPGQEYLIVFYFSNKQTEYRKLTYENRSSEFNVALQTLETNFNPNHYRMGLPPSNNYKLATDSDE